MTEETFGNWGHFLEYCDFIESTNTNRCRKHYGTACEDDGDGYMPKCQAHIATMPGIRMHDHLFVISAS